MDGPASVSPAARCVMPAPERRPLAVSGVQGRAGITVRLTPTQRAMFEEAARAASTEVSRYLREVAILGHTVRHAQNVLKATGA